ncbi:MAG: hypothetical protein F6K44_20090, partial [Moorea sp. SIO3E2]|nr:hypothetical protein [Moorena sp. SIO3E2]
MAGIGILVELASCQFHFPPCGTGILPVSCPTLHKSHSQMPDIVAQLVIAVIT